MAERLAQVAHPGGRPDHQAGGVPAVSQRALSRCRNRPAAAPDLILTPVAPPPDRPLRGKRTHAPRSRSCRRAASPPWRTPPLPPPRGKNVVTRSPRRDTGRSPRTHPNCSNFTKTAPHRVPSAAPLRTASPLTISTKTHKHAHILPFKLRQKGPAQPRMNSGGASALSHAPYPRGSPPSRSAWSTLSRKGLLHIDAICAAIRPEVVVVRSRSCERWF